MYFGIIFESICPELLLGNCRSGSNLNQRGKKGKRDPIIFKQWRIMISYSLFSLFRTFCYLVPYNLKIALELDYINCAFLHIFVCCLNTDIR